MDILLASFTNSNGERRHQVSVNSAPIIPEVADASIAIARADDAASRSAAPVSCTRWDGDRGSSITFTSRERHGGPLKTFASIEDRFRGGGSMDPEQERERYGSTTREMMEVAR